jgi:hypothetical protein
MSIRQHQAVFSESVIGRLLTVGTRKYDAKRRPFALRENALFVDLKAAIVSGSSF